MSNILVNNNIIYCLHAKKQNENTLNNIIYSYCEECGSISIKHNNNFIYTKKPIQKQKSIEVNPIIIANNMKINQELAYPNINNIYNLDINLIGNDIKEKISLYLTKRKLILLYLQDITRKLNYSDLSFYHCLFLVDLYLSHNITEEMDEEELLSILIGFFLITSKYKETDIYEPELINFNNIDTNIVLSMEKILLYETKCLKFINYNFFVYSAYDWINVFISNGYIFEDEIDNKNKEYINEIHTYTYKLLIVITPKNIFIKYSPLYLAITLIQICREEKIDKNKINEELFKKMLNLYDINLEDFENCYKAIKTIIIKEKNANNHKLNQLKNFTNRNQTPTLKKVENNTIINNSSEKVHIAEKYKNEMKENDLNDLNIQSKSNIKKKLREEKLKRQIINLTASGKAKRNFHSIIVNNLNNSKNRNFNIYKKNLEILEYINSNLPIIYNNGMESNKVIKTEGETISGMNFQIGKFKSDTITIKNNLIKSKIGSSVDDHNLKKENINKNRIKISPLKIRKFMRNGTKDILAENSNKFSKFLYKNSTNIFRTENNSSIINKSGEHLKEYNNRSNNKNNDDKDKVTNLIIENYFGNNINKNNNKNNINNIKVFNIFKKYNNIYKNKMKPLFRESTADYIRENNNMNLKLEMPLFINNKKDGGEYFKLMEEKIKKKDSFEKINSFVEKNREMNILTSRNSNKKTIFLNLKYEKNSFINQKDLFIKNTNYNNNSKLPKLKMK